MSGKITGKVLVLLMTIFSVINFTGCGQKEKTGTETEIIKTSGAFLSSLKISVSKNVDGTTSSAIALNPVFNKETENYTITVDSDTMSANVIAVAEKDKAIVSGTGLLNVVGDGQKIIVTVTSEDDETDKKDYKITVKFKAEGTGSNIPANMARIHYKRTNGDYTNWRLWGWNDIQSPAGATWPNGYAQAGTDDYGIYYDINLKSATPGSLGFLFVNSTTADGVKDGGDKAYTFVGAEREFWCEEASNVVKTVKPSNVATGKFRIHYQRKDNVYTNWTIWSWDDTVAPTAWPKGYVSTTSDDFGAVYDIDLKGNMKKVSFLVVNSLTQAKDDVAGTNGNANKTFPVATLYNEVWIFQGDNNVYIDKDKTQPYAIIGGTIKGNNKLQFEFTIPEAVSASDLEIVDIKRNKITVDKVAVSGGYLLVDAQFDLANLPLGVTYKGKRIAVKTDGPGLIDALFKYTGDNLGATYSSGSATLKLWAPIASKVVVDLYSNSNQDKIIKQGIALIKEGTTGVWSVVLNKTNTGITDLHGYYYQYRVTNDGVETKALDPYAKSMAEFKVSSTGVGADLVGKAAIVDLSRTTVKGLDFAKLPSNWKREDAVIWEIHVRDFTSQAGLSLNNRFGTYSAFTEKLNYLKELGVTHIQLLPVMSYYFGDESRADTRENWWTAGGANYNWGYDPQNYFAPEGMYATNRKEASSRIKELKEMIAAIHDAGMAVTLDVVYNHTANTDIMNNILSGYYYRAGKNSSGCGNDTASENAMMRKIIIDSLKYWTSEYKVDGFRFDLMGIIDTDTVAEGYKEVAKINPNTLFIGEGWRMYSGPSGTVGADQDWMKSTNDVAVFSDENRNELKSGYGCEGNPRFLTNGARAISGIFKNIKAQPGNFTADDPGDVVQYIEAHDNLTLHDVITQSMLNPQDKSKPLGASELTEEKIHKRIRIGNAMILTSQGIAFMHAGQEYGRTKEWKGTTAPTQKYTIVANEELGVKRTFIHDSYDSSDLINNFDWRNVLKSGTFQNDTMEYTKGLIALRNSTDAFRLGTKALVDSNVKLEFPAATASDKIIAYSCKSTDGQIYYVLINADTTEREFTIAGLNTGVVLVDSDESGITPVKSISGVIRTAEKTVVDPLTVIVIKK